MSREIKFRAWDVVGVKMLPSIIGQTFGISGWDISSMLDHPMNFIVEQFTGCRDKNGREIYEGDIVRTNVMPGREHELAVKDEVGPVSWSSSGCWDFAGWGSVHCISTFVVGNIHENPELLK